MGDFIGGALVMSSTLVGLFFLRFWRRTQDRFFLFFALAFWILGLNWLMLAIEKQEETRTVFYGLRLVAFALILWAIWEKNRAAQQ